MRTASHLPVSGPRGIDRIRTSLKIIRAPLTVLTENHARYGDLLQLRLGPFRLWSVLDPDAVHHVLVSNAKNYRKSPGYRALAMVLGNGLVNSEGETWKRQRKLSQPAFHHKAVAELTEVMSACTDDLIAEWKAKGPKAKLDAHEAMMGLTMRIVGRALFGTELKEEQEQIYEAITIALRRANSAFEELMLVPTWLPTEENRRFRRAMNILDGLVYRIIDERRGQEPRRDLLGLLMAAREDETGTGMTDTQLRDEIMTLFVAGHETVANALSWAWVCLSENPEVEDKLVAEVTSVLAGRTPTFEDIPKLEYTSRVIDETMRLYPPAWIVERMSLEEDELMGRPLPKRSLVSVCTYLLHRHPKLWETPEKFDPDRFLPERSKDRHRYAYIPFGAGPRICIGNAFAKMEAVIVLAGLVQHWHLMLPRRKFELDPGITLRPEGGVPATLIPRDRESARGAA
jgi:cytochrome P450